MSYLVRHLRFTAEYISNQLSYVDVREDFTQLSKSDKEKVTEALLKDLKAIQLENPKYILINTDNIRLHNYFVVLRSMNVIYPESVTYLMKREGITFECQGEQKREIYNRQKAKAKIASRRSSELQEQLDMMLSDIEDEDDESDEYDFDEEAASYTPQFATFDQFVVTPTCLSQQLLHEHDSERKKLPQRSLQKSR